MSLDRLELEVPPYFGRPLEQEQLMIQSYYDFAGLQNAEHQLKRTFVTHGREPRTLKSDVQTRDWHTSADQPAGLIQAFAAPRPEPSRLTVTSKAREAREAAAAAIKGTDLKSGGLDSAKAASNFGRT